MARVVGLTFEKVVAQEENAVTKKELLEKAQELGLEVKGNVTKADLEKLIKEAEENTPSNEDETPEGDDSDAEVQE